MHDFKNSLLADEDLISIFAYTIEKWDSDQALKYKQQLEKAQEEIRQDPFLTGSKASDDLAEGCRLYRAEHHYFAYRFKNDTIEIARVLHENMDFHVQMRVEYFPK